MRVSYAILRIISRATFRLYFRGRATGVAGVPLTGGVLLAANHQSFLDPVLAALPLPRECHFMARDSLFRNRWFRRLITYLNAFPVRRGSADLGAVKEILRRLKNGAAVVVFPEATRTKDGGIWPINPNSLSIAKKAGVAIVPVIIDGAFECYPRTAKFPRPGRIRVTYAEPVSAAQTQEWPLERLLEVVTQRLHDGMRQSREMRR
jgi:1-acyl-sn-glycerol-3-phosphate acyltransferase